MQKSKGDLLPVIGHAQKQRGLRAIISASTATSDICPPSRAAHKLRDVGLSLLNSVTDYLYREAQECRTSEERDSFSLALAICASVRCGESSPLLSASYAAFGTTLTRHLKRRAQWQWEQHQALLRCIPDYDPEMDHANVEQKSEERGQQARPRNLYEMPTPPKRPQPKPVRELPRKRAVD